MTEYPKITVVIPNYNGGKTIGRTLNSLISQDYPNLEIIVVDGESSDDSVKVIKQYEKHIYYWVSESDAGQSDAINKGMIVSTGDIVNWLCSDDCLEVGSLRFISEYFMENPKVDILAGVVREVFPDKSEENIIAPTLECIENIPFYNGVPQAACFWRRRIMNRHPLLLESYHFKMDAELWCYFNKQRAVWATTAELLAVAYQDGNNKIRTADYRYYIDHDRIFREYKPNEKSNTPSWFRWTVRPLYILAEECNSKVISKVLIKLINIIGFYQNFWRKVNGRKSYKY